VSNPSIEPGYYHAEGDPAGTVRYWDGTRWTSEPMPAPPGQGGGAAPSSGWDRDRFGGVGIRIGAALLDVVIAIGVAIVIAIPLAAADVVDSAGDGATTGTGINIATVLATLAMMGIQVWLIHRFGGTPGKLIVGLRITEADGVTTPPALRNAAMRVIPITLITAIPFVGGLAGLVILVLCLVWVSNDPERRSPYDRIGETRVVYKDRLPG
jgi:uncharacterized RDD family membrane protein YckC